VVESHFDNTDSYGFNPDASGEFGDDEPRVSIPEILEEHRTAIVVSAIGTIGLVAAAVVAKHLIGRKEKE